MEKTWHHFPRKVNLLCPQAVSIREHLFSLSLPAVVNTFLMLCQKIIYTVKLYFILLHVSLLCESPAVARSIHSVLLVNLGDLVISSGVLFAVVS